MLNTSGEEEEGEDDEEGGPQAAASVPLGPVPSSPTPRARALHPAPDGANTKGSGTPRPLEFPADVADQGGQVGRPVLGDFGTGKKEL